MKNLFLLSFLSSLVSSVPLSSSPRVIHERRALSKYTEDRSRVDSNAVLPVRIGLVQQNLHLGYDHLMSVSDPASENYGKHWTDEQIESEFAPHSDSVEAVRQWLSDHGVEAKQTINKGWMAFDAPAHFIEKLLDTRFYEYKAPGGDGVVIGCDDYSLPEHIAAHVDYVTPGVKSSPRMAKKNVKRSSLDESQLIHSLGLAPTPQPAPYAIDASQANSLSNCSNAISPACLRALYDLPMPTSEGLISEGLLGIFESEGAYAQKDLDLFFQKFAPYVPNGTTGYLVSINNATAPVATKEASAEADIDFEIAFGLLGPSNITLYQTLPPQAAESYVGENFIEPFLDAIDGSFCDARDRKYGFQCGGDTLTSVFSASYENPELFIQSYKFQQRSCAEFMKQGLKGNTIIFSSGDYGVASNPLLGEALCIDNGCIPQNLNNTGYYAFNGTIFSPQFPSNCPYVLSVGATMLYPNQTVQTPESAMNLPHTGLGECDPYATFSSSGGFANYFPRPSYQDSAVGAYFDAHAPEYKSYNANAVGVESSKTTIGKNGGIYNRGGRGIPDVSANGANYWNYNMGKLGLNDGTSLSTPLWASIFALINQNRKDMGKGTVGFVNPTLYQHPEVFHDIVNGTNPGCGTAGFAAVEGWDPVTGLGTPNYPALLSLFESLP